MYEKLKVCHHYQLPHTFSLPYPCQFFSYLHMLGALLKSSSPNKQAFIGLESGNIKTYDLLCHRTSAYVIRNAWEVYEIDLIARGMLVDADRSS
jgi:syntaxin-binding protein 5